MHFVICYVRTHCFFMLALCIQLRICYSMLFTKETPLHAIDSTSVWKTRGPYKKLLCNFTSGFHCMYAKKGCTRSFFPSCNTCRKKDNYKTYNKMNPSRICSIHYYGCVDGHNLYFHLQAGEPLDAAKSWRPFWNLICSS